MLACINHLTTQPLWLLIVSFLGFLSLFNYSFTLLNWVYKTVLRQPKNLKENYGSWALITGATDGIGKAFAFQLAKQGLNLILVSRNLNKLKTVSSEIQEEFPSTKIKIMNLDFSSEDSSGLVHVIEEAIKGVDVGVLINNVGITYPQARFFDEVDESTWMSVVKVNVKGTTRVTEAVLSGMIERRRGAIVNIGSGASIVVPSHPLYTIYAATKAYIDQLSRCLYVEYRSCGIDVQCQVPLYVATNMTSRVALIEKSSLFIPSPQAYAEAAIRCIGYEARCTPYWAHSLQWFFVRLLPEAVLDSWRLSIGIHRRGNIIISSTSAGVHGNDRE
ncbi:steroid dehydrogenase, putative [Ricinus communis]|uniref:Steroid dehydrogenase, putative n=2 Tax=Ricinus communis TaxID=3988 RepID=B9RMQ7_RICCO|nr:steroid dehydrogenase, putative [Ricinus communis]